MAKFDERHQRELMKQALNEGSAPAHNTVSGGRPRQQRPAQAGAARRSVVPSFESPRPQAARPGAARQQPARQRPVAQQQPVQQRVSRPAAPVQQRQVPPAAHMQAQPQDLFAEENLFNEEPQYAQAVQQLYPDAYEEDNALGYGNDAYAAKTRKKNSVVTWVLLVVIIVLIGVAAFLVYLLATGGLPFGSKTDPAALPAENPVLVQTADAGQQYVDETLFVGDSNTVRYRMFELVDPSMVAAKESIGVSGLSTDSFIQVTGQDNLLSITETIGIVKPRRMLIMAGTNDIGNSTPQQFAAAYKTVLEEIKSESPNSDVVVAAIPPVLAENSSGRLDSQQITQYNAALQEACAEAGVPFLNTAEVLAGPDGNALDGMMDGDGYHLSQAGLETLLAYYRTHAWNP